MSLFKNIFLGILMGGATFSTVMAQTPKSGVYLSGNIQYFSPDIDDEDGINLSFDNGFGFGVAAGYQMDNIPGRIELEFAHRSSDFTASSISGQGSAELTTKTYMVNGYYDLQTGNAFTPYLGVGLGMMDTEVNDISDSNFAYQGMAGVSYAISPSNHVYGGYRYVYSDTVEVGYHNAEIGYRYHF
jgi:opacity protein-like surface antigen